MSKITNNITDLENIQGNTAGDITVGTVAKNGLRYLDVSNGSTVAGNDGSIMRLVSADTAGTGTTSLDIVKYKDFGVYIANNETDAANATHLSVGGQVMQKIDTLGTTFGTTSHDITIAGAVVEPFTHVMDAGSSYRALALNGANTASMWWAGGGQAQFAIDSSAGGGAGMWTNDGVGWTQQMVVHPDGNITKNNSAAFYVTNSGAGSEQGDGFTTNPPIFPTTVLNRGGGYSQSTHRFTAPVSGLYTFSGNPGYKQNSVDFAVRLQKNGTDVTDVIRFIGALNSHSGMAFCSTIYLAANDYVQLNMAGSGTNVYHRNNSSVPNWFAGYLVG